MAKVTSIAGKKQREESDDLTFEVVTVTPDLAQKWLETNDDNRRVAQSQVEAFARVMRNGGWKVNNQAIGFSPEGKLVDGQHRLWAVIEAGIPVRISVAHGVTDDAVKTIDRGRVRTVAEVLRRDGAVPEPTRVTAWCNSERFMLTNSPGRGGVEDTEAYYRANKKGVDFMISALPGKPPFKAAIIGASLIIAYKKHPSIVEEFVPRLVSGVGLNETSPIYVAREIIIASTGNYNTQRRPLGLKILRCMQALIRGETVKRTHVLATDTTLHYFIGGGK